MPSIVIEETTVNYTSPFETGPLGIIGSKSVLSFPSPYSTASSSINSPSNIKELLSTASQQNFYQDFKQLHQNQQYIQHEQQNQHQQQFEIFYDDDDLFGSPMPFDASEYGLWNGKFVPPPPRPPFLDESIIADSVTTCDLCSWAKQSRTTFIFEGTIEKASELGWPLIIVLISMISAILGAIIIVTIVKCRRNKSTKKRNDTHVQWWSRKKRTNNNLRRSNLYTSHPADSIRGLHHNNPSEPYSWANVTTIVVTS